MLSKTLKINRRRQTLRADNPIFSFATNPAILVDAGFKCTACHLVVLAMMADTLRVFTIPIPTNAGDGAMSKSQDSKKQTKKEPTKTLKEKRAAKKEKKK